MIGIAFARAKIVPEHNRYSITPNKWYMNAQWGERDINGDDVMYIINDQGIELFILQKQCANIGGNDWEFIRPSELGELL